MILQTGCQAEYHPIKTILLYEPGPDLLYALIWPEASNFERAFDSQNAIDEHKAYQQYLRRQGFDVHLLGDLLAAHSKLADHATKVVGFSNVSLPPPDIRKNISSLGVHDQIRLLIERPSLNVTNNPTTLKPQLMSVALNPLPNLYFMRDQLIVTDRGVILGSFKDKIRQGEQEIVELALKALNIDVKYRVTGKGVLEGGDFIPAGDWGLFGCGYRTNQEAIRQLVTSPGADALGYKHLAVIKDTPDAQSIQEMHLDTYFMLIAQDTCLVVDTRIKEPMPGVLDRRPTVDIYDKSANGEDYILRERDRPFLEFLNKDICVTYKILLTEEDQREYGINVLCLSSKKIVGSKRDDQDPEQLHSYEQKLAKAFVDYHLLHFTNIRKGFGSNHCMSQVLLRR